MFFCEYYEIFKSSFFYRTPPVAASVSSLKNSESTKQRQISLTETNYCNSKVSEAATGGVLQKRCS